jgi:hypothetical protein
VSTVRLRVRSAAVNDYLLKPFGMPCFLSETL